MTLERIVLSAACFCASAVLSGCTLQNSPAGNPVTLPSKLSGSVHGGAQAITGAKLYLLAPGTMGNAGPSSNGLIPASSSNASISLLTATNANGSDSIGNYVFTGPSGNFNIANDYSCTSGTTVGSGTVVTLSGSEPIYLLVLGGNPGTTSPNTSIGLLAAIGTCNQPAATINVNELTTVATAYSLAGYATDPTHISSDSAVNTTFGSLAATDISNAFLNVSNLVNVSTGAALSTTPSGAGFGAATTLNSLANILASCVNGPAANSNCGTLFANTATSGTTGTQPSDTASAAINLAHNQFPGSSAITALYKLQAATGAPFSPTLSAQPSNFTVAVTFSVPYPVLPEDVVMDGAGNAWVTSNSGLFEITPSDTFLSGPSGYPYSPNTLAIDLAGHPWFSVPGTNKVDELSSAGSLLATYTGNGLLYPGQIAIDGASNIWVAVGYSTSNTANGTASAVEISNTGIFLSGTTGYSALNASSTATTISIDGAGSAWITYASNPIQKLSSTGAQLSGTSGFTDSNSTGAVNLAIDHAGNAWFGNSTLAEFSNTGASLTSGGGISVGSSTSVQSIDFDGSGHLLVLTATSALDYPIQQYLPTGTQLTSNTIDTGDSRGSHLTIDGSGNLWYAQPYYFSVIEYIGLATPAITPLAAALPVIPTTDGSSFIGTRP